MQRLNSAAKESGNQGRLCCSGVGKMPATLTRTTYSMTATVTDDAELGFLTPQALVSLFRKQPELRQQLLTILSAKVAHSEQVTKALLRKEKLPRPELGLA